MIFCALPHWFYRYNLISRTRSGRRNGSRLRRRVRVPGLETTRPRVRKDYPEMSKRSVSTTRLGEDIVHCLTFWAIVAGPPLPMAEHRASNNPRMTLKIVQTSTLEWHLLFGDHADTFTIQSRITAIRTYHEGSGVCGQQIEQPICPRGRK